MKKYLIFLLFVWWGCGFASAQSCTTPSNAYVQDYYAYCLGTGKLRVNWVSGGSGSYEYALFDSANTNVVRPYSTTDSFINLSAGTYNVHIRSVCSNSVSGDYVTTVSVKSNYTPMFGGVYNTAAECALDGRLGGTNGYYIYNGYTGQTGGYRFSLVNSLNAQEAPGNYVRPIQSNSVFTNLTPGTYYYRIYDDCDNYVTYQATISQITYTAIPFFVNSITELGCDTIMMNFGFRNWAPDSARMALNSYIVDYNDGTRDTLRYNTLSNYYIPATRFDSTKQYTLRFVSACGTTFAKNFRLPQKLLSNDTLQIYPSAYNCDSFNISVSVKTVAGNDSVPENSHRLPAQITYSLDSGATWITQAVGYNFNIPLNIPKNTTGLYQIKMALCGDTLTRNFSYNEPAPGYYKYENNTHACDGRTGFYIGFTSGLTSPVTIRILSFPSGQDTTGMNGAPIPYQIGNEIVSQPFRSILPGKYVFRLQDACGRTKLDSITLTQPKTRIQYTAFEPYTNAACNAAPTGLRVRIADPSTTTTTYLDYILKVYDTTGTLLFTALNKYPGYKIDLYFELNGLYAGRYTFKVSEATGNGFNDTAPLCGTDDTTYTYGVNGGNVPFSLSQSLSVSCVNNMAAVVAKVAGGRAPYLYSLYQNSYAPANQIYAPQASNVFDSLSTSGTYVLRATDSCGTGILYNSAFQPYQPQVYTYGTLYPCANDSVTFTVPYVAGARYQWLKDNQVISGATANTLHFNNFTAADYGQYRAQVYFDSCLSHSTLFDATAGNCGVPLSIYIGSFRADYENCRKMIRWSVVADETVNGAVERSMDAVHFTPIHSFNEKEGSFEDAFASQEAAWYRLKLTGADGRVTYSATAKLAVDCHQAFPAYRLYPVPATDAFRVQGISGQSMVEVLGSDGRLLIASFVNAATDAVDVSSLASGTYLVRINQQQTLPLVIRK